MNINNLKINVRLAFGFGLVLVLMIALALVGVSRMQHIQQSLDAIVNDNNLKIKAITEMRQSVMSIALATRNMALLEAPDLMDKEADRISDDRDEYNSYVETLTARKNSEQAKAVLAKIAAARAATDPLTDKVVALLRENKRAEAAPILSNEVRPNQRKWIDAMDEMVRYQEKLADEASAAADSSYRIALILTLGISVAALAVGAGGAWLVSRSITIPLAEAVGVARRVAAGDLTGDVRVRSKDEAGQLMQALKDMNGSLVRIVSQVRSGTDTITTASREIAAGNLDLSSRTEQQASSIEETASTMEELTSTVKQNADNARQANQLAVTASDIASKGGEVVQQVVATMGSINDSARRIEHIIGVIDGIAFQTNILALNAAVEAARAGEQGRGFAVVATEVRNLAQRSAGAAKEIKELISDSVKKVDAGTKLVDQAGATMQEIVESVKRVSDIVGEISAASQEQTDGIEQINQAIAQMDEVTQQNASLVEEAAAASESLQDQAISLAQVVSVFKMDGADAVAPVELPKAEQSKQPALEARKPTGKIVPMRSKKSAALPVAVGSEWEEF